MSRHYKVTLADALDAHSEALREGGRPGIVSKGSIESAIARPYCGYYRPIHLKAAALLHALVKNHGFVDANKRTALLVTLLMIERSDYRLRLQGDERIDDIVVAVADDTLDFDSLAAWFNSRLSRKVTL